MNLNLDLLKQFAAQIPKTQVVRNVFTYRIVNYMRGLAFECPRPVIDGKAMVIMANGKVVEYTPYDSLHNAETDLKKLREKFASQKHKILKVYRDQFTVEFVTEVKNDQ